MIENDDNVPTTFEHIATLSWDLLRASPHVELHWIALHMHVECRQRSHGWILLSSVSAGFTPSLKTLKCVEGGVLEPILDQSPIKSIRVLWSLKAANFCEILVSDAQQSLQVLFFLHTISTTSYFRTVGPPPPISIQQLEYSRLLCSYGSRS
jgi:hypothetical protein